jgi:hypothetical protein
VAAILFTALILLLAAFQLALAAGAPLGEYAWGGQRTGRLPARLRAGSAVSIVIYLFFALVVLDRAGLVDALPDGFSRVAIWVVFGILALGTVANLASRSRRERFVMTPVAALLALLALVVAIQA